MHNEFFGIEIKDKHCKVNEFDVSTRMFVSLEFVPRRLAKDRENGSFLYGTCTFTT